MDMALELADVAGFAARRDEAQARGKLRGHRHLQHHRARRRAGLRRRRDPLRPRRHGDAAVGLDHPGPGPRDDLQADRLRPARHRSRPMCITCRATPTRSFFGEGTGGSRSATLGGSAFLVGDRQDHRQGQGDRRAVLGVDAGDVEFADGIFSSPRSNRTLTIEGGREGRRSNPRSLPEGIEPGLIADRDLHARRSRTFPMAATSASSRSTRRPARSISCATASSTMSAR